MIYLYVIGFIAALIMALIMTPIVRRLAIRLGVVDVPNHRKVHTTIMPRLGGLAIFIAFVGAFFIVAPAFDEIKMGAAWSLLLGGTVIALLGAFDDKFDLSPRIKLLGQLLAACIVVFYGGLKVELVNVPFGEVSLNMGWLSIPLTIFWIVGVTNAVNFIDGLDGLAAGVSGIATATMLVMAIIMGNVTVILLSAILLGSIIGFLFFNFHPAKIFMGDSGALFLGFSLATLSILGFKQATMVSFIVPLLIMGVPLSDTFFAIIRRWISKKPIYIADKGHLHHCLQELGFSHRTTVLIIYGISGLFGFFAVVLSQTTLLWVTVISIIVLVLVLHVGAEVVGVVNKGKKPLIRLVQRLRMKAMQR